MLKRFSNKNKDEAQKYFLEVGDLDKALHGGGEIDYYVLYGEYTREDMLMEEAIHQNVDRQPGEAGDFVLGQQN